VTYDPDRTAPVPDPQHPATPPATPPTAAVPPAGSAAPAADEPPGPEPVESQTREAPAAAAAAPPTRSWAWPGRPSKRVGIVLAALALVAACCIGGIGVAVGAAIVHHGGDDRARVGPGFDRGDHGPGAGRPGEPGRRGWDERGGVGPGRHMDDRQAPPVGPSASVPATPTPAAPTPTSPAPTVTS
jgi:hypothetical protein